ncbi:MAG TPA: hypothetical protein VIE15_04710 [Acidimicrobiales bacterium]
MVPALIILTLWVALLAPGIIRWLRNHQPTTSIASFHRQLRLLEHSGPKIVEPANRLDDEERDPRWQAPRPTPPTLVLVPTGPTDKESTMRYDDGYDEVPDDRLGRAEQWSEDPWDVAEDRSAATRSYRTVRAPRYDAYEAADEDDYDDYGDYDRSRPVPVLSPDRARTRRTRILYGLGGAIAGTFLVGLLPGMGVLWAVTLLSAIALVGYLGLMYYASNAGFYGQEQLTNAVPIARAVMPVYTDSDSPYGTGYDDGWQSDRIAAAR